MGQELVAVQKLVAAEVAALAVVLCVLPKRRARDVA
jgi:hypothetical protein